MAWYGQKNYYDKLGGGNQTIASVGCFLTSFCNLEEKFGRSIDPPSLNRIFNQRGVFLADPEDGGPDELAWQSITAYDGQVHASNVNLNAGGSWPSSPNSIVKFAYKSPKTGQPTTHFCVVADPAAHTIVDSWDGIIRTPGYYGNPVAWAEYENTVPQPVVVSTPAPAQVSSATDGKTYIFQKGDTVWSVAARFGFTAAELIDHNGITDVRNLPVGYVMHLPTNEAPAEKTTGYTIEVLPEPKLFHVSKPGGCEKWAFGNVKTWTDFTSNGHTPENTNVTIVAVAKVLVAGETAAYYMDSLALGDYTTSGRCTTVGYNWRDITEGAAPEAQPAPAQTLDGDTYTVVKGDSFWNIAERVVGSTTDNAAIEAKMLELQQINGIGDNKIFAGQVIRLKAPEPVVAVAPAVKVPIQDIGPTPVTPAPAVVDPEPKTTDYKKSYKEFTKPAVFIADKTCICKEYDMRKSDHQLLKNQAVSISGTFIFGQTLLGRPTGAVKHDFWYGVPMDNLIAEAELYSTKLDLPSRVALHKSLTLIERFAVLLAWMHGSLSKDQNKTNKEPKQ